MTSSSPSKRTLDIVSSEALKEITSELEGGRAEAQKYLDELMDKTREEVSKIVETGDKRAESWKKQIIGSAEIASRNDVLRTLEDSVKESFADALRKISETNIFKSPADFRRYDSSVHRLISEGVEVIGKGARVACNSRDRTLVSSIINRLNKGGANIVLEEKSLNTVGGVVVTSMDGGVKFDNTFEARLERLRPSLRREVVNLLAGRTV